MHRVIILVNCFLGLVACGYCFDFPEPPNYGWGYQTDLDKYVNADDGYFSWTLLSTTYLEDSVFYVLNMTSQKWVDESFCSRAIWWHFMGVAVPNRLIRDDIAIIYQKGGTNEEEPPTADAFESTMAIRCAVDTGTVCAYVKQVPNQPIVFYNDPSLESRVEDQIIAWSWVSFGETYGTPDYNPALPLRNPMTKAVKRGMDAVNEFVKTIIPESNIDKFLVTGISKRGWTAWSTAMTDRRVIAIIPMVFSLLHMEESVMNHFKALENNWSFALQPYWQENLTQFLLEPLAWGPGGLYDFEDIYRYRSRLNIPKLSIAATGDEFFFPQDFHVWWVNMTGTKLLRMLPNADHVMVSHYMDMYDTEIAFYEFILKDGGTSLPTLTWSRSETTTGAELLLQTNPPPRINPETGEYDVQTWIAVTHPDDTRRDFRLVTADGAHNVRWENYTAEALSTPGLFRSVIDRNLDGEWVGHFIEATWTSPSGRSLTLTTEVNYLPYNNYPGVACTSQEECYGTLV